MIDFIIENWFIVLGSILFLLFNLVLALVNGTGRHFDKWH